MLGMDATALVTAVLAATAPAPDSPPAPVDAPPRAAPAPRVSVSARPARTLIGSIRVAHRSGAISWSERVGYENDVIEAKRASRRMPVSRRREIVAVLSTARRIARSGRLGAER